MTPTYAELVEELPEEYLAPMDRKYPGPTTLDQKIFAQQGVFIWRDLLPVELCDAYSAVRSKLKEPRGYRSVTPYEHIPELRDVCLYPPLMEKLAEFIGEPVGLHLNLTHWVSTERDWHSDSYLNPPEVGSHYLAVWIALDTIPSSSGPFEYVPGSHRWPVLRRERILSRLSEEERSSPAWPTLSQDWVASACEAEIGRRRAIRQSFLGKKGDVLIWHSQLLHRGSRPRIPSTPRRAVIAHYSALSRRPDMPVRAKHNGQTYFVFNHPLYPDYPTGIY